MVQNFAKAHCRTKENEPQSRAHAGANHEQL